MAEDFTVQLQNILDEYSEEVDRATNDSIADISKKAVEKLRANSPREKKSKRAGRYAKGWTLKKERGHGGINTIIVHNKTDYQLTHLLENGHVIKNGSGTYDRTQPKKHIGPVEEWANNELSDEVERKLK